MDIVQATRAYERWLGAHCTVVRSDLARKHERMAESSFVFLRGTFYRWIQLWPTVCRSLADAPLVLSVGDLHVENFGTWRDAEGRLVWGVNDVDEACELPYTQDLVRLATSAMLAIRQRHFSLSADEACEAILQGYTRSREQDGCPIILAEHRRWLRELALSELRDPVVFWAQVESLPRANGRLPGEALRFLLPDPTLRHRVVRRVAGVGSLGRPRFVALASWGGSLIAREAKALLPSASVWARGAPAKTAPGLALLRRAVRVPDPVFAVRGQWIVRRLAPDCSRIELEELPRQRDERKLLRAMGWETANMHLGTRRMGIGRDLKRRPRRWLERAATSMADVDGRKTSGGNGEGGRAMGEARLGPIRTEHGNRSCSISGDRRSPLVVRQNGQVMVILRPTRKLSALLPTTTAPASSDTALGDWYVNRLVVDRQALLLLVSSTSLLPMLIPARDVRGLPGRLAAMVEARLRRCGIDDRTVAAEVRAMDKVVIGPTVDRSVVGIMVDFAKAVPYYLEPGQWGVATVQIAEERLARTPCHAGRVSEQVIFPDRKAPEVLRAKWVTSRLLTPPSGVWHKVH